jgi:type I restriction enzyme R subunit
MPFLDEAQLEIACVDLLKGLGYAYAHGPEIAYDGTRPERNGYGEVILKGRLRGALGRINPAMPAASGASHGRGDARPTRPWHPAQ